MFRSLQNFHKKNWRKTTKEIDQRIKMTEVIHHRNIKMPKAKKIEFHSVSDDDPSTPRLKRKLIKGCDRFQPFKDDLIVPATAANEENLPISKRRKCRELNFYKSATRDFLKELVNRQAYILEKFGQLQMEVRDGEALLRSKFKVDSDVTLEYYDRMHIHIQDRENYLQVILEEIPREDRMDFYTFAQADLHNLMQYFQYSHGLYNEVHSLLYQVCFMFRRMYVEYINFQRKLQCRENLKVGLDNCNKGIAEVEMAGEWDACKGIVQQVRKYVVECEDVEHMESIKIHLTSVCQFMRDMKEAKNFHMILKILPHYLEKI